MPTNNTLSITPNNRKPLLLIMTGLLALSATLIAGGILRHSLGDDTPAGSSFTVADSEKAFTITAHYDPSKTEQVQALLQNSLQRYVGLAFKNERINTHIVTSDVIDIDVKASPGKLKLELNKAQSYPAIYETCMQLKDSLAAVLQPDRSTLSK